MAALFLSSSFLFLFYLFFSIALAVEAEINEQVRFSLSFFYMLLLAVRCCTYCEVNGNYVKGIAGIQLPPLSISFTLMGHQLPQNSSLTRSHCLNQHQ